jgi:hypothetical protein
LLYKRLHNQSALKCLSSNKNYFRVTRVTQNFQLSLRARNTLPKRLIVARHSGKLLPVEKFSSLVISSKQNMVI